MLVSILFTVRSAAQVFFTSITRIPKWLSDCENNHDQSRLAIFGENLAFNTALQTWVLSIKSCSGKLHLFVTSGKRGKYMALSLCWGENHSIEPRSQTSRITKDLSNLHSYWKQSRMPFSSALSIGVRCLWVDSLGIMQEDGDDFARQS